MVVLRDRRLTGSSLLMGPDSAHMDARTLICDVARASSIVGIWPTICVQADAVRLNFNSTADLAAWLLAAIEDGIKVSVEPKYREEDY